MDTRPEGGAAPAATAEEIYRLADETALLKLNEERAVALRRLSEDRLLERSGFVDWLREQGKETGSRTFTVADPAGKGPDLKITFELDATRKLDLAEWDAVREWIPQESWPVRTKLEVDAKALAALRAANPDLYDLAAKAITTKQSRPTAKVAVAKDTKP